MREPIVPQLTGPAFLAWEEEQSGKFELHHGFVFAFAGGTFDHDQIAFNVRTLLARAYPAPCRSFGSDVKVRVSANTYYYADAGIVCEPVAGTAAVTDQPRVVVEVLSPRTRAYDIVDKRAAYRSVSSLAALVFVHTEMRRLEIDGRTPDGAWETQTYEDEEGWLGGHALRLDEVYAGTSLAQPMQTDDSRSR